MFVSPLKISQVISPDPTDITGDFWGPPLTLPATDDPPHLHLPVALKDQAVDSAEASEEVIGEGIFRSVQLRFRVFY